MKNTKPDFIFSGSILLPILGAIPDCGIIIVSGLGEKAEAQEKLSVGVGYDTFNLTQLTISSSLTLPLNFLTF